MTDNYDLEVQMDPRLKYALMLIEAEYNVRASVVSKKKSLLKFGKNQLVGSSQRATLITTMGATHYHEDYADDNLITHLVSDNASDEGKIVKAEGHYFDGNGDKIFHSQDVTLGNLAKVELSQPLCRCTRIYNFTTAATPDDTGALLVGNVYAIKDGTVSSGVPQTNSDVHCIIPAGSQQTFKAATSLSKDDIWIVTSLGGYCSKKTAGFGEVFLEYARDGYVFRERSSFSVHSQGGFMPKHFDPYFIIGANADVRLTGIGDAANTPLGGEVQGYLAKITQRFS